jgi:integrase
MWGLIQFMLFTGCRPSEAVSLRWSEIDISKAVWTCSPKHHKTAHKGKKRFIVIGPQGQQVLNPVRELSRSDYVFDPQVGFEEFVHKAYGDIDGREMAHVNIPILIPERPPPVLPGL